MDNLLMWFQDTWLTIVLTLMAFGIVCWAYLFLKEWRNKRYGLAIVWGLICLFLIGGFIEKLITLFAV